MPIFKLKMRIFSRDFCEVPVQVGARSGLIPIFKLKMCALSS